MWSDFQYPTIIFLIILTVWLVALSLFLGKTSRRINKLIKVDNKESLGEILEELLKRIEEEKFKIETLEKKHEEGQEKAKLYIQKIGLVRFNPFEDTGGDQSFVIALLNQENDGLVLSVLHSRTGARIYSKPVKSGKEVEYELSKEEKEAIQKASANPGLNL